MSVLGEKGFQLEIDKTKQWDVMLLNICLTHLHYNNTQLLIVKSVKLGNLHFGKHTSVK